MQTTPRWTCECPGIEPRFWQPELTLYDSTSSASWCRRAYNPYMDNSVSKCNSGDRFKLHYLWFYCMSGNKHLHSLWPGLEVIFIPLKSEFLKIQGGQKWAELFQCKNFDNHWVKMQGIWCRGLPLRDCETFKMKQNDPVPGSPYMQERILVKNVLKIYQCKLVF